MLPGISSTGTMPKKRPSGGPRPPRNENAATDGRNDIDKGDHIQITTPLFDALEAYVKKFDTQKEAAADLGVSEGTITNVLKTRTQKTFKRDKYVRICKKIGFDTGSPLEQLVAVAGGELAIDDVVALVAMAKRFARKP